jgi:hypothetical protein
MDKDEIIKQLRDENASLKEQLNKYLLKNKNYYENNKEEHKKRVRDYQEKTNYNNNITKEKKKEYARRAYLNKKEKLKKEFLDENI